MAELEEDRRFWDENTGRLVAIIDGIKNFKEKFLEFDEERRSQMLKLMAKKITANSDKQEINGKTYRPKQITIHWRDEFDTLFEAGVIKKLDEIGRQAPRWPRIQVANGGCKKNLLVNERKS